MASDSVGTSESYVPSHCELSMDSSEEIKSDAIQPVLRPDEPDSVAITAAISSESYGEQDSEKDTGKSRLESTSFVPCDSSLDIPKSSPLPRYEMQQESMEEKIYDAAQPITPCDELKPISQAPDCEFTAVVSSKSCTEYDTETLTMDVIDEVVHNDTEKSEIASTSSAAGDFLDSSKSSSPPLLEVSSEKKTYDAVQPMPICDEPEPLTHASHCKSATVVSSGSYRAVVPYSDTEDSDSSSSSSSSYSSSSSSSSSSSVASSDESNSEVLEKPEKVQHNVEKQSKLPSLNKGGDELRIEDLPPIEDLHISVANEQAEEIGKVLHIVGLLVVVESYRDLPPLDVDSVLFLDKGARPLGHIFDVLGAVKEPLYCVRFNSKEHIESYNVEPGMLVYCAPKTEYSHFVFVKKLLMMKGSDASWRDDAEVPSGLRDFSDDEEESRTKRKDRQNRNLEVEETMDYPKLKYPREEQVVGDRSQVGGNHSPKNPHSAGKFRNIARGSFQPRNPQQSFGPKDNCVWNPAHKTQRDVSQQFASSPNWHRQRPPSSVRWKTPFDCSSPRSSFPPRSPHALFGHRPDLSSLSQLPQHSSQGCNPHWLGNERPQRPRFTHTNMHRYNTDVNPLWTPMGRETRLQNQEYNDTQYEHSEPRWKNSKPDTHQGSWY